MKNSLQSIAKALQQSWSADTAYDASDWHQDNPARGQCVVSSLIIQDYLGGELIRYDVNYDTVHETHYANMIDGVIIDATGVQYLVPVTMQRKSDIASGYSSLREKCLAGGTTRVRYTALQARVSQLLDAVK